MKIIFINIGVFIALRLTAVIITLFGGYPDFLMEWIGVPASLDALAHRPWTLITYMFAQYDILHILFNMLWLYWFGVIFIQYFTPKQFFALYIYGGLGGAALYLLSYNIFPYFALSIPSAYLIGASGSVIAIVVATAFRAPDYQMGLLFLGNISLKWIAIVTILIDLISIDSGNAGGHIAHLGGAAIGIIFALLYKKGTDITRPFNALIDQLASIGKPKPYSFKKKKSRGKASESTDKMDDQDIAIMNNILEKIKKSGYSSLSSEEKRKLFDVSKKKS